MTNNLKMLVVLTAIALFSGLVLTVTYQITAPYIALQADAAVIDSIKEVLGDISGFEKEEIDGQEFYLADNKQGEKLAAIISSATGYGGPVEVMVGISLDKKEIIGISILSHTETPGLGTVIEEDLFKNRFVGLPFVKNYSDEVDAITGATYSTVAVIKAVEKAVEFALVEIGDGGGF